MLKEFIYERDFQIYIYHDLINILNYLDIISFSDTKIILKYDKGSLFINGINLTISKLLDNEILIKGKISNIEFR